MTLQPTDDHRTAWHAVTASLGRSNRFRCIYSAVAARKQKNLGLNGLMPPFNRVHLITMLSMIKFGYRNVSDQTLCRTRNTN